MAPTSPGSALTPYLAVDDARAAIRWYEDVLDAGVEGEPIVMPDGRIGHVELAVVGSRLFLSDAHPEIGVVAPTGQGTAVTLHLEVEGVDRLVAAVAEAGGRVERAAEDTPYGRMAVVIDPFGHRWMLNSPV
jgi:uncharacterized glyoxalase superfamily protein PhnB